MGIKEKNEEIVAKVEKELAKHIGTLSKSFSRTSTFSGVVTTLGKTVSPRRQHGNAFTITVIFIGSQFHKIVLSNSFDQWAVIPQGQMAHAIDTFFIRLGADNE